MKKILYGVFAALAVCFSFTSCDDDDFSVDHGTHSERPETGISGTYTGNYEVYNADRVTLENTYPATATITPGTTEYSIRLESTCSETSINGAEENPLNCAWANDEIKFWGPTAPGTTAGYLNSANLNGSYANGTITFRFSKSIRSGRVTVTKFYVFTGMK
ncbi:MAG: hypothetical protein K2H16_04870 [Prevotella sp.]|nr:hypothetical protein [Prevotella sp.]